MPEASRLAQADPVVLQREYYARTAESYESLHERAEHVESVAHAVTFLRRIGAREVLDTGCGTGLAMRCLAQEMPDLVLRGNDPSPELLDIAHRRFGIPRESLDVAASDPLPYPAESFDAVIATGVLHHVPDPAAVVAEMVRVARQAVFISDGNWFAMGSLPLRLVKLGLARTGLRARASRFRHGEHEWFYTEGDGVAWAYSVFDSIPLLQERCAEVIVLPVHKRDRPATHSPLLFAPHCFVAAFKEPLPLPHVAG